MTTNARLSRAASFLFLVDGFVCYTLLSITDQLAGTIYQLSDRNLYPQPVSRGATGNSVYRLTPYSNNSRLLQTSRGHPQWVDDWQFCA